MINVTVKNNELVMDEETLLKDAFKKIKKVFKFVNSDLDYNDKLFYNDCKSRTLISLLLEFKTMGGDKMNFNIKDEDICFKLK